MTKKCFSSIKMVRNVFNVDLKAIKVEVDLFARAKVV